MKPLIIVLCVTLMSACSSTSTGRFSEGGTIHGVPVLIRSQANDQERLFMPDLVAVLQKNGFTPITKGEADYSVTLDFNTESAFNVYCNIVLLKDDVPVVSANGTNPGFGTVLARGAAYRGVFDSALKEFDRKLAGK
jgi:hypothetical protein